MTIIVQMLYKCNKIVFSYKQSNVLSFHSLGSKTTLDHVEQLYASVGSPASNI